MEKMKTATILLEEFKATDAYQQAALYEAAPETAQKVADNALAQGHTVKFSADGSITTSNKEFGIAAMYDKKGQLNAKCAPGLTMC